MLALTGGEDFSHDDGWFIAPPMSSEETPPLHFRLKPKIPLKLRSFISGLRAALRAVGLRNAPAGAVLSPPDPLRWAPAGAPPFLSAEKEKTGRARSSSSQSPLSSVSALRRKLRPLPCSSSPHRTRSAGLRRGPQLKAAGAEFDREGQIRPNAGVFSDGARKFAGLNPAASDSVPPFGALPQL